MPGYTGFVSQKPFAENVGLTYAQVTNQVLNSNIPFGPKGRELDTHAAKDKFLSTNQVQFADKDQEQNATLTRFQHRPGSAHIAMPGYSGKVHN